MNVYWNDKKTFFNLYINDMAAFEQIKLSRLVPSHYYYILQYWGETNKSSLSQIFFKKGILKNFANFKGKHRCWSLFLTKFLLNYQLCYEETPTQVFFYEIFEISKNTIFYRTPPVAASEQTHEIFVVHCVAKW